MNVSEELLTAAKIYLDITWEDEDTDAKITDILKRGMARITSSSGAVDFETAGREQELLLEYARFARSNALEEWEDAYLSEIIFLQHLNMLAEHEEADI